MLLQAGEADRSQISDPQISDDQICASWIRVGVEWFATGISDLRFQISNAQICGIRIEDGIIEI